MKLCIRRFKVDDLKEIISNHFDFITFKQLKDGAYSRKLKLTSNNLSEVLLLEIQKAKWKDDEIRDTAFNIELEFIMKYSKRYEWGTYRFVGNSTENEISDLSTAIRNKFRENNGDALVLVNEHDGLFWISIIIKNTKKIGIYEKPFYIALSIENARHFFVKAAPTEEMLEVFGETLGYERIKKIKLTGKCINSLLKLLVRRENVNMQDRPVYTSKEPEKNDFGFDLTQKANFQNYFLQCMDNDTDINIEHYTITAAKCPWQGDDTPGLQGMEFKSSVTFSGNVSELIQDLPVSSIIKPPFPPYLVNFSVQGKNRLALPSNV